MKIFIALLTIAVLLITVSCHTDASQKEPQAKRPDPLRWVDVVDEYKQWDSKNAFLKDAVLFVGSSSIALWNTAESFPYLPVINRGFGGSCTADALYFVNELIIKYNPKLIIIYEGDNDIAEMIPPTSVHKDFVNLTNAIHTALPQSEIICLSAKLCNSRWHLREAMNELNRLNKTCSQTKNYITFVNVAAVLLKSDGTPNDNLFLPDKLHLNNKGYTKWNALLAPIMKERYAIAINKCQQTELKVEN